MLELYQHDLSDIWDQDLDSHGEYGYALDRFWQDADCHPYVFAIHGQYAGFALVDKETKVSGGDFWMDQFFVLKKYRRQGVARKAATAVFENHPGAWQVGQMPANLPAQAFWRSVIKEYTLGRFTEHQVTMGWWQGLVQCFVSGREQ
jgi:predicted acetyltransferase